MKAKRQGLKVISQGLQELVKSGEIRNVNEGLALIYKSEGHEDLKSFNRWKEIGYSVKKGAKALLLWGEPRPINKEHPETDGEEKGETFFPLCYVFSNLQIEKN